MKKFSAILFLASIFTIFTAEKPQDSEFESSYEEKNSPHYELLTILRKNKEFTIPLSERARVEITPKIVYGEQNKTTAEEAEKRFLLSKQNDQQLRLEKSGKWRIKKNVDGVNFVDRDNSPTKGINVVDRSHEDYEDICTSS